MRKVASRSSQHSKMFGQPASSQTVCRPSARTRFFSDVYSGPVRTRVLIHGGFRSIGVWLLRASRRSSRRPSGTSSEVLTTTRLRPRHTRAGQAPPPRRCQEPRRQRSGTRSGVSLRPATQHHPQTPQALRESLERASGTAIFASLLAPPAIFASLFVLLKRFRGPEKDQN